MSARHVLIVNEEPDDGFEVEHPDTCPRYEDPWLGTVYRCDVASVVDEKGFDDFRRDPDGDPDADYTPPGRYEIEYWIDVVQAANYGTAEVRDVGLRLVEGGDA